MTTNYLCFAQSLAETCVLNFKIKDMPDISPDCCRSNFTMKYANSETRFLLRLLR